MPFKLLFLGYDRLLVQLVLHEQVLVLIHNHFEGIGPVQEVGKAGRRQQHIQIRDRTIGIHQADPGFQQLLARGNTCLRLIQFSCRNVQRLLRTGDFAGNIRHFAFDLIYLIQNVLKIKIRFIQIMLGFLVP
ncbi:hypothetical protein D3C75_1014030 [compost metagenome]